MQANLRQGMRWGGWAIAILGIVIVFSGVVAGANSLLGPGFIGLFAGAALAFASYTALRSYAFTLWVLAAVSASLAYPGSFESWGFDLGAVSWSFDLGVLIVPLIQIIMFGMGTTLSLADFKRVGTMPWPVFLGFVLQFSVMPLLGYFLALSFNFPNEIAAGIVLIGSCPGGVASNLMVYLARANVALSVTMTACSTIIAPLATPWLMYFLASQYVDISIVDMMLTIVNLILVPVLAGLVANKLLYGRDENIQSTRMLLTLGIGLIAIAVLAAVPDLRKGASLGLSLIGVTALTKVLVERVFDGPRNWMDRTLPIVSMAGIIYIIAIITAASYREINQMDLAMGIGTLLLVVVAGILHNLFGYLFGYWLARGGSALGEKVGLRALPEQDCRTVAFEVGMQNGGMASSLAFTLFGPLVALAPAIFGPWMNVSGSMLATYWRRSSGETGAGTAEAASSAGPEPAVEEQAASY
jgi:BASS family bile acid:Na+ symporter